ncbi:hypothetical protein HZI73_22270 [Vallitalea pronyensis]|uniref:Uncharacterized protein n=1 Tax=Vallitalea pronyensis TaxID=1348613 RepID=A0A8J8MP83_9FIRM|nr:hypothetical protein [Vallitalea pronyensis]QUI24858.1 hypothetical protein HZI73_22270 [Vallitalea pronyensis]
MKNFRRLKSALMIVFVMISLTITTSDVYHMDNSLIVKPMGDEDVPGG